MARPKLGDSPTRRIDMKITEDEVRSINHWAAQNGVSSMSEAIRQLVKIGLERGDA